MNFKLEGKYFTVFISIAIIFLVSSIVTIFPLYESIENTKKHKQMKKSYYMIDNQKYAIDSIDANGSIILKRVSNEN